jgi:hypothetical protein
LILGRLAGGVYNGSRWLRIGAGGGLLWIRRWTCVLWRHGVSYRIYYIFIYFDYYLPFAGNLQKHSTVWIKLTTSAYRPIVKHICKVSSIICAMDGGKLGWRFIFPRLKNSEWTLNHKVLLC